MRLLIEKFEIDQASITDIQRQILTSGSNNEKLITARQIADEACKRDGNIDANHIASIIAQSILRYGVNTRGNLLLTILNGIKDESVVKSMNNHSAQKILDLITDNKLTHKNWKTYFEKDIGIFEGSTTDIDYKLDVLSVFMENKHRQYTREITDDSGKTTTQQLTLDDLKDGDKLKPTSEIRKLLDEFTTPESEDETQKEKKSFDEWCSENNIKYLQDTGKSKIISWFEEPKFDPFFKSAFEGRGVKNKAELNKKLASYLYNPDDQNGAKIKEIFTNKISVVEPYEIKDAIHGLVNFLDVTKGGKYQTGLALLSDQIKTPIKDLSIKSLITYIKKLMKVSNVAYIKDNIRKIEYRLDRGFYDKEIKYIFTKRYPLNKNQGIKSLNEEIARFLQSIYGVSNSEVT